MASWANTPVQVVQSTGLTSAGPLIWVDFNYSSNGNGTFATPYNTLAQGLNATLACETILIKSGSTRETPTITKPLRIQAYGGPATIGR